MTISTTTSSVTVFGNGATTSFTFSFVGASASDLTVLYTDLTGTPVTLSPVLYTVVLNAPPVGQLWGVGGTVTYPISGSPIAAGTSLTIVREVPLEQTVSISNQGAFYPQAVEQGLDLLELELQQVSNTLDRAVTVPEGVNMTPLQYLESILPLVVSGGVSGVFQTTALLLSGAEADLPVGSTYVTGGRTVLGDGGGGVFYLTSDLSSADNGGTIRVDTSGRRWYAASPSTPGFSVKMFGAKGDGSTNDTSAIQAALTALAGTVTYFPKGNYPVTFHDGGYALTCPNNTTIIGADARTTTISPTGSYTYGFGFGGLNISNFTIKGMSITSADSSTALCAATGLSTYFLIDECSAFGGCLFFSGTSAASYALASTSNSPNNIIIRNCNGYGTSTASNTLASFVGLIYVSQFQVLNSFCTTYENGIYWWGGDSAFAVDGDPSNLRKATDGLISGCTVYNTHGGIWGSMGRNILVSGCVVKTCSDVCLDAEGCQEVSFVGCKATDGINGCLTTFAYTRNILFEDCDVTMSSGSYTLGYRSYNSSGDPTKSLGVSILGGSFIHLTNLGTIDNGSGPVLDFVMNGTKLRDVILTLTTTNTYNVSLINLDIGFSQTITSNAVSVQNLQSQGGRPAIGRVRGCTLYSETSGNSSKTGINCTGGDVDVTTDVYEIDGNVTYNFGTDIVVHDAAGTATYIVANNKCGNNTITSSGTTTLVKYNNYGWDGTAL